MRKLCTLLCLIALPVFGQLPCFLVNIEAQAKADNQPEVWAALLDGWQDSTEPGWLACYHDGALNTNEAIAWADSGWISYTNTAGVPWLQYRVTDRQTRGRITENLIAVWRSTTHIPATKLKLDRMIVDYEKCANDYGLYRVVSTNGVP